MGYIQTRAGRLFVEAAGRGPAVLLWHSFLCDRTMWRAQVDALQGDYRLILIDGPGHGLSSPPPPAFALADCALAALEVLDAAGVERAVVGGISWGGIVAMQVALRAPERVRALALLDTSADRETPFARLRNGCLARIARRYGILTILEPFIVASLFSRRVPREAPEVCARVLRSMRAADRETLFRVMTAIAGRESFLAELGRIRVPTLVVVGGEDRLTRPLHSERIARRIAGARLEVIAGAGHLTAVEAPAEVTRLLQEFLGDVVGPEAGAR